MVLFGIVLFMTSFTCRSNEQTDTEKTIMLILGSADLDTSLERVNVGVKLYHSDIDFDYVIVSGGCGAHQSSICEATEMKAALIENGVPEEKIYKEEKSASTVQNYCFSRILKKSDGSRLMNPGDKLYVVSNHWHAMSVAARFNTYDKLDAVYHIEGKILPATKDKVDYTNIYNHTLQGEDFCDSSLWAMVNASFASSSESANLFIEDAVYENPTSGLYKIAHAPEYMNNLPSEWTKNIDAAFLDRKKDKVYLFKGSRVLRFSAGTKRIDADYPMELKDFMNVPEDWGNGYVNAAFYNPEDKKVYLFNGEQYLKASLKRGKLEGGELKKVTDLAKNWPFKWGKGDIDAAHYEDDEEKIYLFRGKEFLLISESGAAEVEAGFPRKTETIISL